MQVRTAPAPRPFVSSKWQSQVARPAEQSLTSEYAFAEIGAYIAIRDRLLAEAEESRTDAKINRALIANEFVESCLKPARAPYQAQHLPEPEAIRARKGCEAVKTRIARLRAA